ncbi:hypothetical protein PsorP6_000059 [Peronosclerospora sorghi]|uniref:Uncharacterized protein n=1 Tax=Peronosclerospora sorghi TaxID=230839 RepID=A0ACC0WQC8_9STRA|nr:hypothetical protein PsorP6_000059 [Peronosclerospora sorghi]
MSEQIASDDAASNVFLETDLGKGRLNIIENKWSQLFAMIAMSSDKKDTSVPINHRGKPATSIY